MVVYFIYRYIDHYTCMNNEDTPYDVRDASKSFPSGHASISLYGSISLVVSVNFEILFSLILQ